MRGQSSRGGRWSRTKVSMCAVVSVMEELTGNDDFLDLRRAFVDAQCPDLAIQTLDRLTADEATSAQQLQRLVDHLLGRFRGCEFRHRGFAGDACGTQVPNPG